MERDRGKFSFNLIANTDINRVCSLKFFYFIYSFYVQLKHFIHKSKKNTDYCNKI